jgi:alkylation response protein AidB-like acyl-CoA dehydrogenase
VEQSLAALPSLDQEYEGYGRIIQLLKGHIYGPSSATSGFHLILADGVAALLLSHLRESKIDKSTRALFQYAYDRLTSPDPQKGWASGLWMTERGGGSDLTPTETTATYSPLSPDDDSKDADGFPLGPWVLNGLKWFSTGTEANMAIAVARTEKGLSAFYVPMRRAVTVDGAPTTELNGVRIRRLKKKLGTKPLPTSELELNGMRGWLVGKEGKGINEIGIVLNVTRVHLAVGVVGYAGRALAAARAFAKVRKVARGTPLSRVPLHMRSLARAHIAYRAHMMLGFFVTALLAKSEQQKQPSTPAVLELVPKSSQDASCLLRLLGSVSKASAAMDACSMTQCAVESLGGVGYLENEEMAFNVSRLWRDAVATLIGEGTVDVLATDVVKVMKGKIGSYVMAAFGRWVKATLPSKESLAPEAAIMTQQWAELQTAISKNSMEYLTMNGREIMDRVCKLSTGILLLADAARDDNPVAIEVARRWIRPTTLLSGLSVEQELMYDQQIVFGNQPTWLGEP